MSEQTSTWISTQVSVCEAKGHLADCGGMCHTSSEIKGQSGYGFREGFHAGLVCDK